MHFCDSVWSFQWMRLAGVGFPYRLYIYVLPLDIRLSRREDWDPINRFNSATVLCAYR